MKRLLIILFLAMTAVCANAQKELNVDSIIRVEIKKLFEPEGIKNHPSYPYIIFGDYYCFNNFIFSLFTYAFSSHITKSMNDLP